jgi:hypothetical protein
MVYFCLSLGYVLLRIMAISLSAASVNEQSCQVRNILYSVPSTSFSVEVRKKFHSQGINVKNTESFHSVFYNLQNVTFNCP